MSEHEKAPCSAGGCRVAGHARETSEPERARRKAGLDSRHESIPCFAVRGHPGLVAAKGLDAPPGVLAGDAWTQAPPGFPRVWAFAPVLTPNNPPANDAFSGLRPLGRGLSLDGGDAFAEPLDELGARQIRQRGGSMKPQGHELGLGAIRAKRTFAGGSR